MVNVVISIGFQYADRFNEIVYYLKNLGLEDVEQYPRFSVIVGSVHKDKIKDLWTAPGVTGIREEEYYKGKNE